MQVHVCSPCAACGDFVWNYLENHCSSFSEHTLIKTRCMCVLLLRSLCDDDMMTQMHRASPRRASTVVVTSQQMEIIVIHACTQLPHSHLTTRRQWTQARAHQQKKLNKWGNQSRMYFEPTHDTTRPLKQGSLALSSDISSFTTLQREQSSVSVNHHTQKHSQGNKTWGCI